MNEVDVAFLFKTGFSRSELLRLVGQPGQLGGVRLAELADGAERGVRVADFDAGSGLTFSVLADRCMDIGWASFRGAALAWRSPTGFPAPAFYEPEGSGWLRGFGGGLLTTCGLTHFGHPTVDEGQALSLHGRASYLPARHFNTGEGWDGDEYELWATGVMRQTAALGEHLALRRRISIRLGETRLWIDDLVTNEGFAPTPHMLCYHFNLGFPLVGPEAELYLPLAEVSPRDAYAAGGLAERTRCQPPTPGYREQVFDCRPTPGLDGYVTAALVNRAFGGGQGLGLYLRYRAEELPYFVHWKMMGEGAYVVGLEPATNFGAGRDVERAAGRLIYLQPGESRRYRLEVGVLASQAEIARLIARPEEL